MNTLQRFAKNTSILFVAQLISYILGFFYVMYSARYLGVEEWGVLSFAIAFTGIFGILTDFGLSTLTVKEISKDKSVVNKYFGNLVLIKIIFSILTFLLIFITINLLKYRYPQEVISVVYLIALSIIFAGFSQMIYSLFQAFEKMEYQSVGIILNSSLLLGGIFLGIYYKLNVEGFAFLYLLANLIVFIYITVVYFLKPLSHKFDVDLDFLKATIINALPFGFSGVFTTVYLWIDTVILSLMQGNEAVGLYNAAYRLILVLLFIPTVFNISIFPIMSRFYVSSKSSLLKSVEKYFKLMLLIGIPIGIGTTLLADKIILLIFGAQYEGSIFALQILIWSTICIFIYSAFVQLLLSINQQMSITKITGIALIVNIILNLILIQKLSYIGASIVTTITEFVILILVIHVIYKIKYDFKKIDISYLWKFIVAGLIMGFVIIYLKSLSLPLIVILAILTYSGIIILIKGIDKEDLNLLKMIKK